MITNKDIRVENGFLIINGDKFPLDGQSPEAIMEIVEDNSDTTPTENSTAPITSGGVYTADKAISDTIGDITQTGITGASVAAQLETLKGDVDAKSTISVVQPDNESVSVTGPYTDIEFTKPVETGYTFYLIGAVAINLAGWNMSNINPVAGSIRIFTSDTSAVTSQVKTTWLKIKN